jgi:pyruvate,orthophosphate dikinase
MVFGNGGYRSGSGVAFTRNPATGTSELYLDFLFDAQGEDVVSGRRTPMDARALAQDLPEALAELKDKAAKLEHALGDVQDIEFTVENGRLYFLQTRSAKRTPRAALRIAVDLVHEGLVTPEVALGRLKDVDLRKVASSRFVDDAEVTSRGTPAASGVVSGRAAFDSAAAKRLAAAAEPVVLIRREPATEDIEGFAVADGILTSVGGRTAHAAVVARQLGKVCIVGCSDLVLQEDRPGAILAGKPLSEGGWVSLDGDTGEVTLGRREIIRAEPIAELEEIERWKRDRRLTS